MKHLALKMASHESERLKAEDWSACGRAGRPLPGGYCWGPGLQLPEEDHHQGSSELAAV